MKAGSGTGYSYTTCLLFSRMEATVHYSGVAFFSEAPDKERPQGKSNYFGLCYCRTYSKYVCLVFFCLFKATPIAYGGSHARGPIGAAVANLHHSHSNPRSELHLQPTPQLTARRDPLTHRARPGIEPTSSWILVGFLTR